LDFWIKSEMAWAVSLFYWGFGFGFAQPAWNATPITPGFGCAHPSIVEANRSAIMIWPQSTN
jgi:hypothetical protein